MRRVLFIIITLWFTGISAQTELPSPSEFLKDVESELSKGLAEQAKWFNTDFAPIFTSTQSQFQDTVISTVIKLQETNTKTSTAIYGYLNGVLVQLKNDSMDVALWNGWHKSIVTINENRRWYKKLSSYLQLSEKLMSSGVIADSRASKWQFMDGQFSMGVDSIPYVQVNNGTLVCYAKGDSASIRNTSGRFLPTTGVWLGDGGQVHWGNNI